MNLSARKSPVKPRRILVVDDDDALRENLKELFETMDFQVVTAENAAEALRLLEADHVDVLLTDYKMTPGLNGVELIATARKQRPTLLAILMTAFGDGYVEIESVRRGAIGYLPKPFGSEDVLGLVDQILSLKGEE